MAQETIPVDPSGKDRFVRPTESFFSPATKFILEAKKNDWEDPDIIDHISNNLESFASPEFLKTARVDYEPAEIADFIFKENKKPNPYGAQAGNEFGPGYLISPLEYTRRIAANQEGFIDSIGSLGAEFDQSDEGMAKAYKNFLGRELGADGEKLFKEAGTAKFLLDTFRQSEIAIPKQELHASKEREILFGIDNYGIGKDLVKGGGKLLALGGVAYAPLATAAWFGAGFLANSGMEFRGYAVDDPSSHTQPGPNKYLGKPPAPMTHYLAANPIEAAYLGNRMWGIKPDANVAPLDQKQLQKVENVWGADQGTRLIPVPNAPHIYRVYSERSAEEMKEQAKKIVTSIGTEADSLGGRFEKEIGRPGSGIGFGVDILLGVGAIGAAKGIKAGASSLNRSLGPLMKSPVDFKMSLPEALGDLVTTSRGDLAQIAESAPKVVEAQAIQAGKAFDSVQANLNEPLATIIPDYVKHKSSNARISGGVDKILPEGSAEQTYMKQIVTDQVLDYAYVSKEPYRKPLPEANLHTVDLPEFSIFKKTLKESEEPRIVYKNDAGLFTRVFGTASNQLDQKYGKTATTVMRKLIMTDFDYTLMRNQSVEVLENIEKKLPREWSKNGASKFIDLIEGREEILNAPPEVKQAFTEYSGLTEKFRQAEISFKRSRGEDVQDSWGLTKDGKSQYFHHFFQRGWKVVGPDGESSGIGNFPDPAAAKSAIQNMAEANSALKAKDFTIVPNIAEFNDFAVLSKQAQKNLVNRMLSDIDATPEEVSKAYQVLRLERPKPGAVKYRSGKEGYLMDFQESMRRYVNTMSRRHVLGKTVSEIEKGISELENGSQTTRPAPEVAAMLRDRLSALRGESSSIDNAISNTIQAATRNKVSPGGWNRWTSAVQTATAINYLTTGRYATGNAAQTFVTLFPYSKTYFRSVAEVLFKDPEAMATIEKFGIDKAAGINKFEFSVSPGKIMKGVQKTLGFAEPSNVKIAYWDRFKAAKALGMDDAAAHQYGVINGMLKTQFYPLITDRAMITSSNLARQTVGQLGRFKFKEAELLQDIGMRMLRDGEYGPMGKYMLSKMIVGGVRTVPIAGAGYALGGKEAYDFVKSKVGTKIADLYWAGIPSFAGIDMLSSFDLTYLPYGSSPAERIGKAVIGPTYGSLADILINLNSAAGGAQPKDQIRRYIEAFTQPIPLAKELHNFLLLANGEKTAGGYYNLRDARDRIKYVGDVTDVLKKGLGFTPLEEAQARMIGSWWLALNDERQEVETRVALKMNEAFDGNPNAWSEASAIHAAYDTLHIDQPLQVRGILNRLRQYIKMPNEKNYYEGIRDTIPKSWQIHFDSDFVERGLGREISK